MRTVYTDQKNPRRKNLQKAYSQPVHQRQNTKKILYILMGLGLILVIGIGIFLAIFLTRPSNEHKYLNSCETKLIYGNGFSKYCTKTDHNGKCNVECNVGYLGTSQDYVCENGKWKGTFPTCLLTPTLKWKFPKADFNKCCSTIEKKQNYLQKCNKIFNKENISCVGVTEGSIIVELKSTRIDFEKGVKKCLSGVNDIAGNTTQNHDKYDPNKDIKPELENDSIKDIEPELEKPDGDLSENIPSAQLVKETLKKIYDRAVDIEKEQNLAKFPGLPIKNVSGSDCFLITALNLLWTTPLKEECKETDSTLPSKSTIMNNVCSIFNEQDPKNRGDNVRILTRELNLNQWKENEKLTEEDFKKDITVKGTGKLVFDVTIDHKINSPVKIVRSFPDVEEMQKITESGKYKISFADKNIFKIEDPENVMDINSIQFEGTSYNCAHDVLMTLLGDPFIESMTNIFNTDAIFRTDQNYYEPELNPEKEIFFIKPADNYDISSTIDVGDTKYILAGIGIYTGCHWFSYLNYINDQNWIMVDDHLVIPIGSFEQVIKDVSKKQETNPNLFPSLLMYHKIKPQLN